MASPDENSASFYALHVALQTLKERCQNLQHRLTTVEEENEALRKTAGMDLPNEPNDLRGLVGDLVRQKSQLSEHIGMVTKENRQLWSRLSKLTKENSSLGMSLTKIRDAINNPATPSGTSRNNNLIRSKTFTRPNPKLRDRIVDSSSTTADGSSEREEEENMSLEEISLQIINKLVEGKENFEQKCGEILETTTTDNLCFGFKGTKAAAATGGVEVCEVADTIDKCTSEATVMKDALLQQQNRLKQLIQGLKENKKPICNDCITRNTDPSPQFITPVKVKSVDSQTTAKSTELTNGGDERAFHLGQTHSPDGGVDRTCPMCGKRYNKSEDFEIFQRHVEWHFIDDNEMELSIDKNYEMISHTAQNF